MKDRAANARFGKKAFLIAADAALLALGRPTFVAAQIEPTEKRNERKEHNRVAEQQRQRGSDGERSKKQYPEHTTVFLDGRWWTSKIGPDAALSKTTQSDCDKLACFARNLSYRKRSDHHAI